MTNPQTQNGMGSKIEVVHFSEKFYATENQFLPISTQRGQVVRPPVSESTRSYSVSFSVSLSWVENTQPLFMAGKVPCRLLLLTDFPL